MDYGGSSFEHDTSRLHSTSLDFKAKRKGYDDDMNRSGTVSAHKLFSVFLFLFLSYLFSFHLPKCNNDAELNIIISLTSIFFQDQSRVWTAASHATALGRQSTLSNILGPLI